MIGRILVSVAIGAAVAALAPAQPMNYAIKASPIRAGVLIIESQRTAAVGGEALNPMPHIWGQLERDRTTKPAGWTLVNPRAQTTVTTDIISRWTTIHNWVGGGGSLPGLGARISKREAAYWEVFLDRASDEVLSQYDVLFLAVRNGISLNSREREKLRKFADQGGAIWIDLLETGPLVDVLNPPPVPFALRNGTGAELQTNPTHPLLNYPNTVTADEVRALQSGGASVVGPLLPGQLGAIEPAQSWIVPDSYKLRPIVGESVDRITMGVSQLGEGYIVVTTRAVSNFLNRGIVGGTVTNNSRYFSDPPNFDAAFSTAAKLAINAISLNSGFGTLGRGSRKSNSSPVDITAPLLRRFATTSLPSGPGSSAALFKGRLIVVRNNQIIAMDSDPNTDLNQDGNPDDGIADTLGSGQDVLWSSAPLTPPLSAPTCVEITESATPDKVLVVDGSGVLHSFVLDPVGPNFLSVAPEFSISPPSQSGADSQRNAPAVHESIAFVADTNNLGAGRVWVSDLVSGQRVSTSRAWGVEGAQRLPAPSAGATVGYIPILDNSGGVDKVLYVPTRPSSIDRRPCGMTSLWFGARGENPIAAQASGNQLIITTRASLQNLSVFVPSGPSSLGVKISLVEIATGTPFNTNQLNAALTGSVVKGGSNGVIVVGLKAGAQTPSGQPVVFDGSAANTGVRVDYTIDWGAPTTGFNATSPESYVRGDLQFPDEPNPTRVVLGSIALGSNGNIFVATAHPTNPGGSLFAFKEEGRGEFKMLYRYELHDLIRFTLGAATGGQQITYDPAIIDYDGVNDFLPFLRAPLNRIRFQGGPTVRGNAVYMVATSGKNNAFLSAAGEFISTILAFDANPKPQEIVLNNVNPSFTIVQPDIARSLDKALPTTLSALQTGNFTYEVVPGTTRGNLRINNMMSTTRGRIRDSLAANLPIILRQGGQPDIVIEPEAATQDGAFVPGFASGRWSPLKWYVVMNGLTVQASPVVAGTTLYMGGASFLPALLDPGPGDVPFQTTNGIMIGVDVNVSSSDLRAPSFKQVGMVGSIRPWQRYWSQISGVPPAIEVSPYLRWPQYWGVTNFDDFRVRFRQAVLEDNRILGLAAGDGVVASWGDQRLHAFSRADFLIADEGRVSRFDSAGNPLWTAEESSVAGSAVPTGVTVNIANISKPWRVYPSGSSAYWVVDTGNDRVALFDSSGKEQRSINAFKVDPNFHPEGLPDNSNKRLRMPKDMLTFTSIVPAASNRFTSPQPFELWRHYLIADTGNFRIVELVDRFAYDPATKQVGAAITYLDPFSTRPGKGERALGVIVWHSRPELTGKQYAYSSIDRVFIPNGSGGSRPVYAFGFGNVEPGKRAFGLDSGNPTQDNDATSGNGGVVLYDPAVGGDQLITEMYVPSIGTDVFFNPTTGNFNSAPVPVKPRQKISGLTSATVRYEGGQLVVMLTDVTGVYEVVRGDPDNDGVPNWVVRWMLPTAIYKYVRRDGSDNPIGDNPQGLRANFARRLDSGEVVIANGYFGRRLNGNAFSGEVILLDGRINPSPLARGFDWNKTNLGFNSVSVRFELPPVQGVRGLVAPVFADRR